MFIADSYYSMFCHISFTLKETYVPTICPLATYDSCLSFKVGFVCIASNSVTSYYRIFSGIENEVCLYAFTTP